MQGSARKDYSGDHMSQLSWERYREARREAFRQYTKAMDAALDEYEKSLERERDA